MIDGGRLHLQDGPIDLIVTAEGSDLAVQRAHAAARARFETVLDELCAELALLRAPSGPLMPAGIIARRMARAVRPFADEMFITPMAAVAGSVAEEILGVMAAGGQLDRAFVNNGGDIALHLGKGRSWRIGLIDRPDRPSLFGAATIGEGDGVGGIATSGWRGCSFSLGIADAVTVLAATAAEADAGATVIANAVDLPGHAAIERVPANNLQPDSDLGSRKVTRGVGPLSAEDVDRALEAGVRRAEALASRRLIIAAALHLAGVTRVVGARPISNLPKPPSLRFGGFDLPSRGTLASDSPTASIR